MQTNIKMLAERTKIPRVSINYRRPHCSRASILLIFSFEAQTQDVTKSIEPLSSSDQAAMAELHGVKPILAQKVASQAVAIRNTIDQ